MGMPVSMPRTAGARFVCGARPVVSVPLVFPAGGMNLVSPVMRVGQGGVLFLDGSLTLPRVCGKHSHVLCTPGPQVAARVPVRMGMEML